ncbi:MAG TPA: guanylate kinase [Syntrophobacteraceae bacterium]|nr:guanylate kinase [Syntrophobacteraceae bacterium]
MSISAAAGQLFIVSAPSGVGKSTIISKVIAACPKLQFSISCTTRPMRSGEVAGKDYHFISREEFARGIKSGRFLEWAEVHGHLYGTDGRIIEKWLKAGDDVLLDIDVQGARMVRCAYPSAITIFILPPSLDVLEERLRNRASETREQFAIRISAARREILESPWYDYIIINDSLQDAVDDLRAILRAGRSSRAMRAPKLKAFLMSV